MKRALIITGLIVIAWSCVRYDDQAFFKYPVIHTTCVQSTVALSPALCFGPIEDAVLCASVVDSLLLTKVYSSDFSYVLRNLNTGETINSYLSAPSSLNDVVFDGRNVDIYDIASGCLTKVDITGAAMHDLDAEVDSIELNAGVFAPYTHVYRVYDNQVLAFDSANSICEDRLESIPKFILFNSGGKKVREFDCFKDIPLVPDKNWAFSTKGLMDATLCFDTDRKKMAFCMWHMPQINIMDLETGETFGVKLKGKNKFTHRRSVYHFVSVCSDSSHIYALYCGISEEKYHRMSEPNSLYVFDWAGNMLANYSLDALYTRVMLSGGKLYLERYEEDNWSLYSVPPDDMRQ